MDAYQEFVIVAGYYRLILLSNAAICTLLYPLVAYLVAYHSPKEMGPHRWCLLYAATHCYALMILMAIWQPVPLLPLLVATSRGCVYGVSVIRWLSALRMIIVIQLSVGHCFTFIHYYAALAPMSRLSRWYGGYGRRAIAFAACLGVGDILCIGFQYPFFATPDQLRSYVAGMAGISPSDTLTLPEAPGMAPQTPNNQANSLLIYQLYINEPNLVGFVDPPIVQISVLLLMVFIVCECVLIVRLNIGITAAIAATKSAVLPATHQLQRMLQRLFLENSLFFIAFFAIPLLAIFAALFGAVNTPYVSIAAFVMINMDSPIVLARLLWMRPYRNYLLSRMGLRRPGGATTVPAAATGMVARSGSTQMHGPSGMSERKNSPNVTLEQK